MDEAGERDREKTLIDQRKLNTHMAKPRGKKHPRSSLFLLLKTEKQVYFE
ncbi:hypothetical protein [Geobacillus thermodenitrificans]|uniref:Uncharacterized protein n=1 Tax=Geobacillus thermodenitrificans TaxID=33940 RepID=A0ABY9QCH1_GEOTD|nr:hypothetical protein [Geobacillus thermodenitrificans]WMV76612.1 hypothetical protein HSX42_01955 [Geobacillus thermodenitrificans]